MDTVNWLAKLKMLIKDAGGLIGAVPLLNKMGNGDIAASPQSAVMSWNTQEHLKHSGGKKSVSKRGTQEMGHSIVAQNINTDEGRIVLFF